MNDSLPYGGKARILNFGSLNIDHVYQVDHIVRPGETLAGDGYEVFAGGKGANQSTALALAGADVAHCGRIGEDGVWLLDGLRELHIDVGGIVVDAACHTGHAVIQVETGTGENAIFLYPGGNEEISDEQIEAAFSAQPDPGLLLLQNEISNTQGILQSASASGWHICLNPAPFSPEVLSWPLHLIDLLVVNQTEAAGMAATSTAQDPAVLLDTLCQRWPQAEILLTLGDRGAMLCGPQGKTHVDAVTLGPVLDTTAAGDTFIGYYLAARAGGLAANDSLRQAATAAGICVTRRGARTAIPRLDEVQAILRNSAWHEDHQP